MKLATLNRWLRKIGIVLVVTLETETNVQTGAFALISITLNISTAKAYDARIEAQK